MTKAREKGGGWPRLALLLVFVPVALVLQVLGVGGLWLFLASGLGILGTVTLIGKGTEEVAAHAGPVWGGLLNATFGNVTELIIALFALKAGLHEVVRASITGSILGNLLLVLGAAMFYGGLHHPVQRFSRTSAQVNVGMLYVALAALFVPSFAHMAWSADPGLDAASARRLVEDVSLVAAGILLLLYALVLVFSLRTHRFLIMPADVLEEHAHWSRGKAALVLLLSTAAVAWLSEAFVGAIEDMIHAGTLAMSQLFVGVVVVAVVGNAAEGMVAVWVAREDKMDLSFQVAMGSCLQVALLVAPVLVLSSWAMGDLMSLAFNPFELLSLAAAVVVSSAALNDGESHWLEGAMFLAVYLFFALVFWFHP
jgi:Ca2+:H+ antiporter